MEMEIEWRVEKIVRITHTEAEINQVLAALKDAGMRTCAVRYCVLRDMSTRQVVRNSDGERMYQTTVRKVCKGG